jgi:NAD(P)-dependent dehydrogenase (short-subunit alcohol dehydrogenase family)
MLQFALLPAALVFITGSMDGLGRAAAQSLIGDGHQVVLHARSADVVALAFGLARRWPQVLSNAVDPGSVRTSMGCTGAPLTSIPDSGAILGWLSAMSLPPWPPGAIGIASGKSSQPAKSWRYRIPGRTRR